MATTTPRSTLEAHHADVDRVAARRFAREVATSALRSRRPAVLAAGHRIIGLLEEEREANRIALTTPDAEEFIYWSRLQGDLSREIRDEAGNLDGLLRLR